MPEIISIVGTSNSGKTTLLVKLIAELKNRGYRVGTIKHTHHPVPADSATKDSGRHRAAGAETVILAGSGRISMVKDCPTEDPEALKGYFLGADIILTEGYKSGPHPKVEVHRRMTGSPPLFPDTQGGIIALVTDGPPHRFVPTFGLEDIPAIVDLIETQFLRKPRIEASNTP